MSSSLRRMDTVAVLGYQLRLTADLDGEPVDLSDLLQITTDPGGNITGVGASATELARRLEQLVRVADADERSADQERRRGQRRRRDRRAA
jgi:hypothetical protein